MKKLFSSDIHFDRVNVEKRLRCSCGAEKCSTCGHCSCPVCDSHKDKDED